MSHVTSRSGRTPLAARAAAVLAIVVVVGYAPGMQNSVLWTAAWTTAWMPLITFVALWISWRPANRRQAGAAAAIVLAAAAALVAAAMALVAGGWAPPDSYFPFAAAPLVLLFLIFLQISLVCEGAPFDRYGWRGGVAALVLSAAAAAIIDATMLNWHSSPSAELPPGFRSHDGPIAGADAITWLTVLAAWQVVIVVVADGYPGRHWPGRRARIAVNNVVTVLATCATYLVASACGVPGPWLAAAGGCVVAGGRLPFSLRRDGVDRHGPLLSRFVRAAVASVGIFGVLLLVADTGTFDRQPRGLWIAVVSLNLVSGGITWVASLLFVRAGDGRA